MRLKVPEMAVEELRVMAPLLEAMVLFDASVIGPEKLAAVDTLFVTTPR